MSQSRTIRENIEDLELRLAPSHILKRARLVNFARDFHPNFITINDDDENDIEILFTHHPREALHFFPNPDSWVPVVTEEDLELRLGPRAPLKYFKSSTGVSDFSEDLRGSHCQKYGKAACNHLGTKEVRLKCTICMDIMKEETSTVCGHLFCKSCITNAILAQKRCPVCRLKLSICNIHPVYLPEAVF